MSLFSFLAHTLRAMGHEEAAADVERGAAGGGAKRPQYELEDDDAPRAAPAQAGTITHGEHDGGHGGSGGAPGHGGGGGAAGAESGAGGDHGAGAGGGGGSTTSESAGAPAGGSAGGEKEERAKPADAPAVESKPEPSLADDPMQGLHSERLKERLHHDAAKGASQTANDSEIHRLADQARSGPSADEKLFPSHILDKFTARGAVNLDTSPAAQAGRIAALGGEIPGWAQGDPHHDPALIRAAAPERTAAGAAPAPHSAPAAASSAAPAAAHAGGVAPDRER